MEYQNVFVSCLNSLDAPDYQKDKTSKLEFLKYGCRSLGIRKIRRLNLSRGSREGNNAFTKDRNVIKTEIKVSNTFDIYYRIHNIHLYVKRSVA